LNSLNNLKFLYLRNNKLSGSIPNFNLPNLQILSLGSNLLSGSIPNFNMPNLQILSLGSNQLNGSIPDLDLPSLEQLSLGSNQLNGEIPKKIENLYNLQILRLDANRFAGPIPIELCNLTNLNTLSLTSNEFIGEIPNEIEKLKKLKYLNLSGNNLDGELPIEIFELINLNQLIISFNQINGTIPKEIGKLKNLTFINLSFNKLGGQIPLELCDLQNLRQINLHNNKLNGQIPNELGKLKSLQFLYLHDNLLNGQIPKELGSLQNLQSLGLDKNSLDGTIPKEIGNLSNLYQLRLNNNRFSGCLDPYLKIFCKDSVRIEIFSGIFRTYKMEVNLSDNPLLPWQGDFSKFCTTDGSFEKQRGVPCDDGDPQTINDSIQVDCSCKGTIQCGTHPDFATLESIYILTNGDNWKNNTGWKDRNIAGKCDPCNGWYGISCKNGRVDSINFFDNKLDGRLLNLKSLEKLRFFSCRDNLLKGQVPEVYENLELEVLDLRGNSFSGKAPNISKNIKLKYFDISFNKFTDSFPSISNNKDIEIISCRFNQMIGPLPNLSNNLNLIDVNFGDNSFSGSIPDLTNCVKLESFACYFNSLTGSIPDISKNIKIKHFGCYVNQLTGEIPTLTKNINLEGFSCGNNSIQGQIPNLDANINLGDFSCSTNSLSGSIPDLKKLTRLHSFDCSNNKLTGNIPDFSNQKDELVNGWDNFNFSNNDLSGCYNNSICKFINIPIRFNGNPKLPNKGNHIPFCAGVSQIGASCDNGNTADGTADIIDQNCNCVSGCRSGFGLISGAKEICTGSISTLTASGGFQYRWNNGSTSNSITISPSISSTFIVTVTDTLGCVATASKTVSINTLPHAKIAGDPVMCPGGNTTLGATGGTSYLWNNGVTTGSNFIKAPGKYIVTVTDANGCTARDSVTVITLDAGKQPIPKDDTLYVDEDIVYDLDLLANDVLYTQNITVRYGKNLGNDIRFTSQSPDGKVKLYAERRFTEALTLTYEICDQCDQCASAKLIILPEKLKNIIQTTLITPLESANNTLQFSDVPISDSELWVYNRWGQQVFHAKGYKNDWDADGVPGGVYYYVFKVYGFTIKKALTVVK
jgi:Leucine-rich repeat (LRR) protein